MTPEEVHAAQFRKPPIGKRGYDEQPVDEVLGRIEKTLRGEVQITRTELRTVSFRHPPIGRRGYNKSDVDAFLQRISDEWPGP